MTPQGKFRKLSEILQDLADEGVDPEDVLVNDGELFQANPVFNNEDES